MALYYVYAGWPVVDLFSQGWFPFAVGDDGNLWLLEQQAPEDPIVHVLELTAWDGGLLGPENGLITLQITSSELLRHGAIWSPPE